MIDYTKVDWGQAADTFASSYAKKTEKSNKALNTFDATKYLNLQLGEKETEGEVVLRILPNQEDPTKFYETKKYHNLKVGKDFVKLYDPAQDGEESPLNDRCAVLRAGDKVEQESAKQYYSKDFYILRVIQRGKEHEGVKFWRFAHNSKKEGIMDKLKPLITRLNDKKPGAGAIWNPIAGRDIIISLVKEYSKNKKPQTKVVAIQYDPEISTLSDDDKKMNEWLNDPKTWKDVYGKKSLDYLRIVADGGEPIWDTAQKKYVPAQTATEQTQPTTEQRYNTFVQSNNDDDIEETSHLSDVDLPF